ncbi:MAG: AAA family ATPase, partial [Bacilli bacterium]|nr:AAA family ATPase [Bacilli bacterium]
SMIQEIKGQLSKKYEEVPETEKKPQIYVNKNNLLPTNVDLDNIDKNALASYVKSHIFENDSVIDDIVTTIAMNYSAKRKEEVKSMLSIGNTGCGKTATYELISEYLGVPFTIFDCTNMSASGYQGDSVSDLVRAIYRNAKDKPQLIGKSIVVLEEFDKIAARGFGVTDINVQHELLKFLDGYIYHITSDKVLSAGNEISVDTTFMTKAGLGAFEELFEKNLREARGMGFAAWNSGPIEITDKDINDFGMTKQIIRRFLLTFLYKDLSYDDLRHILTTSKGSPLVIAQERYIRDFNTILEYTSDYVDAVVEYSLKIKSGAGGLKKAVAKSLIKADSAVYDRALTSDKSQKRLLITAETVANPCKFTY